MNKEKNTYVSNNSEKDETNAIIQISNKLNDEKAINRDNIINPKPKHNLSPRFIIITGLIIYLIIYFAIPYINHILV